MAPQKRAVSKRAHGTIKSPTPRKRTLRQAANQGGTTVTDTSSECSASSEAEYYTDCATQQKTSQPKGRPPPVTVDSDWGEEFHDKFEKYNEGLGRPFTCKLSGQGKALVLRAHTLEDHLKLLSTLREAGEQFKTQSPRHERTERYVATRLPIGVSTERVLNTLQEAKLPVQAAHRKTVPDATRGGSRTLTAVICTFAPGTPIKTVSRAVPLIAGCQVWWQRYDCKGVPVQCYNCQDYQHASKNCGRKTKCRKCSAEHNSKDCPGGPTRCANCGEGHRSTYRGCSYYQLKASELRKNSQHTSRQPAQRSQAAQRSRPSQAAPRLQPQTARRTPTPPSPSGDAPDAGPPPGPAPRWQPQARRSPRDRVPHQPWWTTPASRAQLQSIERESDAQAIASAPHPQRRGPQPDREQGSQLGTPPSPAVSPHLPPPIESEITKVLDTLQNIRRAVRVRDDLTINDMLKAIAWLLNETKIPQGQPCETSDLLRAVLTFTKAIAAPPIQAHDECHDNVHSVNTVNM